MLGDDKLSVAVGGRGQFHLKGAALQGGAGVAEAQGQPGTGVAGPVIADDVAEGSDMGGLYLPHALPSAFCLQPAGSSLPWAFLVL